MKVEGHTCCAELDVAGALTFSLSSTVFASCTERNVCALDGKTEAKHELLPSLSIVLAENRRWVGMWEVLEWAIWDRPPPVTPAACPAATPPRGPCPLRRAIASLQLQIPHQTPDCLQIVLSSAYLRSEMESNHRHRQITTIKQDLN